MDGAAEGIRMASGGGGNTAVVRLLGGSGGGGGSGLLCVLVMGLLLVHPGRGLLGIVMLAGVHWVTGHHLGDGMGGPRRRANVGRV